jgi:hypothetical protein
MPARPTERPGAYHHTKSPPGFDVDKIAEGLARLEQLEKILTGGDEGDGEQPTTPRARLHRPSQNSAALTRSIKRYRYGVAALMATVVSLGTILVNVYSYLQGYANDRAQEVIAAREAAEAAQALVEKVHDNASDITDLRARAGSIDALERNVSDLSRFNALQWDYLMKVIDALQQRKKVPAKPQELQDAELQMRRKR